MRGLETFQANIICKAQYFFPLSFSLSIALPQLSVSNRGCAGKAPSVQPRHPRLPSPQGQCWFPGCYQHPSRNCSQDERVGTVWTQIPCLTQGLQPPSWMHTSSVGLVLQELASDPVRLKPKARSASAFLQELPQSSPTRKAIPASQGLRKCKSPDFCVSSVF